jgi:hypothetical protein
VDDYLIDNKEPECPDHWSYMFRRGYIRAYRGYRFPPQNSVAELREGFYYGRSEILEAIEAQEIQPNYK